MKKFLLCGLLLLSICAQAVRIEMTGENHGNLTLHKNDFESVRRDGEMFVVTLKGEKKLEISLVNGKIRVTYNHLGKEYIILNAGSVVRSLQPHVPELSF